MKRKIAGFSVVVYNNDGQVEIAFDKAKKVPKPYDSFVACLEIACLNAVHKVIGRIDKDGDKDRTADTTGNNADNKGDPS